MVKNCSKKIYKIGINQFSERFYDIDVFEKHLKRFMEVQSISSLSAFITYSERKFSWFSGNNVMNLDEVKSFGLEE